jgi:hypothetical protein
MAGGKALDFSDGGSEDLLFSIVLRFKITSFIIASPRMVIF